MAGPTNSGLNSHAEWSFQFILQSSDGESPVPEARCNELLDLIIAWAELSQLAIGGGYEKHRNDEL